MLSAELRDVLSDVLDPVVAALLDYVACPPSTTVSAIERGREQVLDRLEKAQTALGAADTRQLMSWFIEQRARVTAPHRLDLERFRIAIRSSPIVAFEIDLTGRVTWLANTPHKLVGRRLHDLMSPGEGARLDAVCTAVRTTGERGALDSSLVLGNRECRVTLGFEGRRDLDGAVVALVGSWAEIS